MVYLDNAATTKTSNKVVDKMLNYFTNDYGNPSSIYEFSDHTSAAIKEVREIAANSIGAKSSEIIFTSGGTESDNMALRGVEADHVITSKIEHAAILNTCKYLESKGTKVTYLNVDEHGLVNIGQLVDCIDPKEKTLVSIMMINNEIGTIQDIKLIGEVCHEYGAILHTDAVQAYPHLNIDVNYLGIDMMSVSGHKFNGPRGVGFLYVRDGIKINPLLFGGHQENSLRPGTENTPAIVGLGEAIKSKQTAVKDLELAKETWGIREALLRSILYNIPHCYINGGLKRKIVNIFNIQFKDCDSSLLVPMLGERGICVSAGSACNSGEAKPSHVLKAIGLTDKQAKESIRFSLDENNLPTIDEVLEAVKIIEECCEIVRGLNND